MPKKTSIEAYFSLEKNEPDYDFAISAVTDRLGILPTKTKKKGEWVNMSSPPKRKHSYTQWKYRTGRIETYNFEMVIKQIVHTFKDKVDTINELKQELQLEPKLCAVVYVEDGISPGYLIESEVMQFAINIGAELEIDDFISGFVENEIDNE
ncbi:DUF4279 domain-containing protein [Paucisalibacillus globulus]|uniref:DUF4279 domain-containing protein n=1 Tax=Paucisalibacillus globulus TaxID=351095 RepID=UPI000BB715C5|nr:DUF4279 domain-containing protein [Paucisalibacillus globulus]